MMNKKYKEAFTHVAPCDESIERMLIMTKKKRISFKPLLVAAVILALMVGAVFSTNAATDGEVFESIKVFFNGKQVSDDELSYSVETEFDEDGKEIKHYKFEIDGLDGEKYQLDAEDAFEIKGFDVEGTGDAAVEIYEFYVPTTVEAN